MHPITNPSAVYQVNSLTRSLIRMLYTLLDGIQYVGYPTVLPNQAIYRPRPFAPMLSLMPARRLEDRIRDLCARALHEEGQEWAATIHELQAAIQEHGLRVANLTSTATVAGRPEFIAERRNR